MATELGFLVHRPEGETNLKPHCLFLSGGLGTYAGIRGIKESLEKQYGTGGVDIFNSIFSSD